MIFRDSKGREVEITEVNLEIGEGCHVVAAVYLDTDPEKDNEDVPDDELDYLTEAYQGYLYEDAYASKASDAYDSYKASRYEE